MLAKITPMRSGTPTHEASTANEDTEKAALPLETLLNFRKVKRETMQGAKYVQTTIKYMTNATTAQPVSSSPPMPVGFPRESPSTS